MKRAMITTCLAAILGAPVVAWGDGPAGDPAQVEPSAEPESMIDVHVGETISRSDALAAKIREDVVRLLRAHRIELAAQTTTRLVIGVGGEDYAYRVSIGVLRGGTLVPIDPASWPCECTNEELLVQLSQHVVDLVPLLRGQPAAQPAAPRAAVATVVDAHDAPPPSSRRSLGPLGKGGVAALAIGAGLAIGGAVLVARGRPQSRDFMSLEAGAAARDLRPGGYALLGIGGAAIVAGAVLLGVDRHRVGPRRTSWSPMLGPRTTGFSLTTRF
jgi:hypothetical protein